MKQTIHKEYLTPEVEVVEIIVERGICSSLGGIDPDPTNPGENPSLPGTDTEW